MRQQKWKQKRMITGRDRERGGRAQEGDCLSTQEAEELPYTVSASLVSQHGREQGAGGREQERRIYTGEMCRDVANVMENAHWNRPRPRPRRILHKAKGGH